MQMPQYQAFQRKSGTYPLTFCNKNDKVRRDRTDREYLISNGDVQAGRAQPPVQAKIAQAQIMASPVSGFKSPPGISGSISPRMGSIPASKSTILRDSGTNP